LVWLNYWTIKNGIDREKITINFRIYDTDGNLIVRTQLSELKEHNEFSVREVISDSEFFGMIEIEIISLDNLKFVFPAITGVYKSGSYFSGVHSAGRIKGSDENHSSIITEETNWECKFRDGISPFFHYIHGPKSDSSDIIVKLYSSKGDIIDTVNICESFNAFGSKIYFIDEVFSHNNYQPGTFAGVECDNHTVFRRMVVGNYHKKINHLEVTHSFPKQNYLDYCSVNDNGFESFLAMYSHDKFDLKCRVFPTNCEGGNYSITTFTQKFSETKLSQKNIGNTLEVGYGKIYLEDEVQFKLLSMKGVVPSRFNTNFIYSVKDCVSEFSTDIATGAKSNVYPPKHNHWGLGIIGSGYDFVLMIRNNNHLGDTIETKAKLTLFGLSQSDNFTFEIKAESSKSICLSDLLDVHRLNNFIKPQIFSWMLSTEQPYSETFWVSWRKTDGCILGCHGF